MTIDVLVEDRRNPCGDVASWLHLLLNSGRLYLTTSGLQGRLFKFYTPLGVHTWLK